MRLRRLRRSELPVASTALARFLIGKTLVRTVRGGRMLGRIVESEAYLPGDAACHAFGGMTPRNRALFMRPGHAYVYFIYGNHFMLNVSGEEAGVGGGVLLRAAEPLDGLSSWKRGAAPCESAIWREDRGGSRRPSTWTGAWTVWTSAGQDHCGWVRRWVPRGESAAACGSASARMPTADCDSMSAAAPSSAGRRRSASDEPRI
jgi:hypothetical protein